MFKKILIATSLLSIMSGSAIAADDPKEKAAKMKKKARHQQTMAMMRNVEQEMVQDDKYLYILRGPQLLKVLKKDLSISRQTILIQEKNQK